MALQDAVAAVAGQSGDPVEAADIPMVTMITATTTAMITATTMEMITVTTMEMITVMITTTARITAPDGAVSNPQAEKVAARVRDTGVVAIQPSSSTGVVGLW